MGMRQWWLGGLAVSLLAALVVVGGCKGEPEPAPTAPAEEPVVEEPAPMEEPAAEEPAPAAEEAEDEGGEEL